MRPRASARILRGCRRSAPSSNRATTRMAVICGWRLARSSELPRQIASTGQRLPHRQGVFNRGTGSRVIENAPAVETEELRKRTDLCVGVAGVVDLRLAVQTDITRPFSEIGSGPDQCRIGEHPVDRISLQQRDRVLGCPTFVPYLNHDRPLIQGAHRIECRLEAFEVKPQGRWQLAQQWSSFFTQCRDVSKKNLEWPADVFHRVLVGDFPRNFDGKPEAFRRGSCPSFEGRCLVAAIEG